MGQTLTEIAQQLRDSNKKVQLIYAFNGVGKTRLSREFISPKDSEDTDNTEDKAKVIYYNAFTEDLFYWNNTERKLKIQPNTYTQWVLKEQGKDQSAITHFQRYTSDKLTPKFSQDFSEVSFSITSGDDDTKEYIKISKGEESNFIWSIFYSLIEQIIDVLNVVEASERETDQFNKLEYIFIDDPVSSLDDNHLIELAVNTAELIKSSKSELKFVITTHNPLFYNVIFNEFNFLRKVMRAYRLEKMVDGTSNLVDQPNGSPFSYHLYLFSVLKKSIETGDIQKYHFSFLRNILEKTSTFLGFKRWEELIPGDGEVRAAYVKRILNYSSHSKQSGEEVSFVSSDDKNMLKYLVNKISADYNFKSTPIPPLEENP